MTTLHNCPSLRDGRHCHGYQRSSCPGLTCHLSGVLCERTVVVQCEEKSHDTHQIPKFIIRLQIESEITPSCSGTHPRQCRQHGQELASYMTYMYLDESKDRIGGLHDKRLLRIRHSQHNLSHGRCIENVRNPEVFKHLDFSNAVYKKVSDINSTKFSCTDF